jgi:hypothetical protein
MAIPAADLTGVMVGALVMGAFGGVGLILMHVYTRRGPLLYFVYAALLLSTALMLSQYDALPFATRFLAVLVALSVASLFLFVRVAIRSSRRERIRVREGRPPLVVTRPWWGMPTVVGALAAVSAGVALVLR